MARRTGLLIAAAVLAGQVAAGCGGATTDRAVCLPPVRGGSPDQQRVVRSVLCAIGGAIQRVTIRMSPRGEPSGSAGLVFLVSLVASPGSMAPAAQFSVERASWEAAIAAGAIRDRARAQHLPHVVSYTLYVHARGAKPELEGEGRIALPGWGDPEGQGRFPPAALGKGALSYGTLLTRVNAVAAQTHTRAQLGWAQPLGGAPYLTITARDPGRLLAGPIRRYLDAVDLRGTRYDGVLVAVFDARSRPVWVATTANRIGSRGCSVLLGKGTSGRLACAYAGMPLAM